MKNGTKLLFTNGTSQFYDFFLGGNLKTSTEGKYYHPDTANFPNYYVDDNYTQFISTDGKILPVYDLQSLKQNLECRCSTIKGELPYNVSLGIPLKTLPKETELAIINLITSTKGVKSCTVVSRDFNLRMRKLSLVVDIKSSFGDIKLNI